MRRLNTRNYSLHREGLYGKQVLSKSVLEARVN